VGHTIKLAFKSGSRTEKGWEALM